jgi:hypothetical protein
VLKAKERCFSCAITALIIFAVLPPRSSARQSVEDLVDIARTCGQRLYSITRPSLFCLARAWPALRTLLHATFSQLVEGGLVTLPLDGPLERCKSLVGPVDCVQLHFEQHAHGMPDHSLKYCKVVDGYTGMTNVRLRLKNQRAFWAYVAAFRYVARTFHIARKSVMEKSSFMVLAVPRAVGAVHSSDRLSICAGLFAMRVGRALSGVDGVFAGHDREKCRGLAVMIANRVCSRYCASIEVSCCVLFVRLVVKRAARVCFA